MHLTVIVMPDLIRHPYIISGTVHKIGTITQLPLNYRQLPGKLLRQVVIAFETMEDYSTKV